MEGSVFILVWFDIYGQRSNTFGTSMLFLIYVSLDVSMLKNKMILCFFLLFIQQKWITKY
jgi:hypothetical protein